MSEENKIEVSPKARDAAELPKCQHCGQDEGDKCFRSPCYRVERDLAPSQPQHHASEDVRERATEAVAKAWYGPNFDPFSAPEYWAMAETVADAVLAALHQPGAQVSEDAASRDVAGLREVIAQAVSDYDNFMLDDAYDSQRVLDKVANNLRAALSQPQPAEPDAARVERTEKIANRMGARFVPRAPTEPGK